MRACLPPLLVACALGLAQPCRAEPLAPKPATSGTFAADGGKGATDTTDELPGVAPLAQGFVGDAWAQDDPAIKLGPWSFRMLLQTRYERTFAEPSEGAPASLALRQSVLASNGDGFSLKRFFFRVAINPSEHIRAKSIIDFSKLRGSDLSGALKQAYMLLRPLPKRLELVAGLFKLPYSILELDPVARFEVPNLGQADNLVKDLGFAGRDVGVEIMVAPLRRPRWLRMQLGIFHGHAQDEHASPIGAVAARIESKPVSGLRIGLDAVGMPRSFTYKRPFDTSKLTVLPNPADPLYPREQRWGRGIAYSADISFTRKRFSVRLEAMLGDRVDIDTRYGARAYWAVWALIAHRFKLGPLGLMPAARVEWLDVDPQHAGGGQLEVSAALNLLYKRRVRWVLALTRTDVQPNTSLIEQPRPLPAMPYVELDRTRVTLQLQLEL